MSRHHLFSMYGTYMLMAACIMSSMFPATLYLTVAIVSMIVIIINTSKPIVPKTWLFWGIIYLVSIVINCFYSSFFSVTLAFLRSSFTHFLIAAVFICSIKTRDDFVKVVKAFVFIGILASLIVLYKERSTLFYLPLGTETFGGGNIPFTYILIPASMSCIFLIVEERLKYCYFIMAFLLIVALLTTSRKAIFLPIVFFVLYLFFHSRKVFSKTFKYILVGCFLGTLVFLLFLRYDGLSDLSMRRLTSLFDFFTKGEGDDSLAIREALIQRGISYISERPILGYGMGTFSAMTGSEVYSHNNFIETLFGGGILMLLVYYSIYLISIVRLWKKTDSVSHFLIAAIIVYLISDYGTVSYFVYPQLFIIALAASVSMMSSKNLDRIR